jgi:hypothetical protein
MSHAKYIVDLCPAFPVKNYGQKNFSLIKRSQKYAGIIVCAYEP